MKVAISVPDPVFKAAEQLASKQGKSRSQFYAEALAAYVGAQGEAAVREQLNKVCAAHDSRPDPVMSRLQLRTLDPDETW